MSEDENSPDIDPTSSALTDNIDPAGEEIAPATTEVIEGSEPSAEVEVETVDEPPVPDKGATQKRIDELTRKRHEAERRAAYAEGRLAAQTPPPQIPPKPREEPRPREADFDDLDKYQRAIEAWTDRKVDRKIEEFKESVRKDREENERAEAEQRVLDVRKRGRERYADFADVAENENVPITPGIIQIVQGCENPEDIYYYLGKNPKDCITISRMSPIDAARTIGSISADIKAAYKKSPPPKTKITNAPAPIKPIHGSEIVTKDPNKMDDEEFREWRRNGGGD